MCQLISCAADIDFHAVAVRTMMELVKREYLTVQAVRSSSSSSRDDEDDAGVSATPSPSFGTEAYGQLIDALVFGDEVNIDILLLLKDEVW